MRPFVLFPQVTAAPQAESRYVANAAQEESLTIAASVRYYKAFT